MRNKIESFGFCDSNSSSGNELVAIHKVTRTAWPSTQGVWTPFTNRPYQLNQTQFPNLERGTHFNPEAQKTATQQLLEMYKQNGVNNILIDDNDEIESQNTDSSTQQKN